MKNLEKKLILTIKKIMLAKNLCNKDTRNIIILPKLILARFENEKDLNLVKNIKNYYKNQAQLFFSYLLALFLAG